MTVAGLPSEAVHLPIVRPKTYGDCSSGPRPCPWVSCRHNLLLDVSKNGAITLNLPKSDRVGVTIKRDTPGETSDALTDEAIEAWFGDSAAPVKSCALDESRREHTLEEAGEVLNMTRERVRQIEEQAKAKLPLRLRAAGVDRSSRKN